MANEVEYDIVNSLDAAADYDGSYSTGWCVVGSTNTGGNINGALRFRSVVIPQGYTVNYARLFIKAASKNGSGRIRFIIYGINENNTNDFFEAPFVRSRTSAHVSVDSGMNDFGDWLDRDVSSIVNEIVGRSGWSSGNAMGFTLIENNSDDGNRIFDYSTDAYLMIRLSAAPNMKPTPITVPAPTFPAAGNWGLRISKPGIDVKTATDSQLLFTSKRKVLKVKSEGEATCVAGTLKQIAHNLGYPTPVLVFIQGTDGKRFKLNRILYGTADPVTNGKQGICGSSNNNLEIYADGTAYYYILIDPLVE